MIERLTPHYGDPTVSAAVRAGDLLFLAHHAGDITDPHYASQTRSALHAIETTLHRFQAELSALVQVTMWVREITDETREAWDVLAEFFGDQPPARTTATSDFYDAACLVQLSGIADVDATYS